MKNGRQRNMQPLESIISGAVSNAVSALFGAAIEPVSVTYQRTNPAFEGDITLVVFPYVKLAGKSPEATGAAIGTYLEEHSGVVERHNVIKGFLNLAISDSFWK